MNIAFFFGQFGPYHHARIHEFQRFASSKLINNCPLNIIPIQLSASTTTYKWNNSCSVECNGLLTLFDENEEDLAFRDVFFKVRQLIHDLRLEVCFVPSYYPARYLAISLACFSLNINTIMMNESHKDTERATGLKKLAKKFFIRRYKSALVGGRPHRTHFASLGIPLSNIFTGYDAVDNSFYTSSSYLLRQFDSSHGLIGDCLEYSKNSDNIINSLSRILNTNIIENKHIKSIKDLYLLPPSYFLNIGRMVAKKNLSSLISAYSLFASKYKNYSDQSISLPSLVLVGDGPLFDNLFAFAKSLQLDVVDLSTFNPLQSNSGIDSLDSSIVNLIHKDCPKVYFYGFRQLHENTIFYSFANSFFLPSLYEEWGLVVNEAMACSLPVVVSRNAGCCDDLLPALFDDENSVDCLFQMRSNGFAIDSTSRESISNCMYLLSNDQSLNSSMARNSFDIVSNFSCHNFARGAYNALLAAL